MHMNRQTVERLRVRRRAWCHRRHIVAAEYVKRSHVITPPGILASMAASVHDMRQPRRNRIREMFDASMAPLIPADYGEIEARVMAVVKSWKELRAIDKVNLSLAMRYANKTCQRSLESYKVVCDTAPAPADAPPPLREFPVRFDVIDTPSVHVTAITTRNGDELITNTIITPKQAAQMITLDVSALNALIGQPPESAEALADDIVAHLSVIPGHPVQDACEHCEGTGRTMDPITEADADPCPHCKGTGSCSASSPT